MTDPIDPAGPIGVAAQRLRDRSLVPLVEQLARRMGASTRPVRSVTVTVDDAGRAALADLLGLARIPPATTTVSTTKLAQVLGVDAAGLRAAVETVAGPVGNRADARAETRAALAAASATVGAAAEALGGDTVRWAETAVRSLPGPVDERVRDLVAVIGIVLAPRDVPLPVPVAAADVFGDPHALDTGTRRGDLLAACAAVAAGQQAPGTARARRRALATVNLVADEVSSTVLTWAVIPGAAHPQHASAAALTAAGEPVIWTLSTLQRWPVDMTAARVLVVENPAIVTVAAIRGFAGPVVCTAGVPSVAAVTLLEQLADRGARLDVHADLDTAGFGIVTRLVDDVGARPWHMDASDYTAALPDGRIVDPSPVPATPWDPELGAVFAEHRLVIYEEQVLDQLLGPVLDNGGY